MLTVRETGKATTRNSVEDGKLFHAPCRTLAAGQFGLVLVGLDGDTYVADPRYPNLLHTPVAIDENQLCHLLEVVET